MFLSSSFQAHLWRIKVPSVTSKLMPCRLLFYNLLKKFDIVACCMPYILYLLGDVMLSLLLSLCQPWTVRFIHIDGHFYSIVVKGAGFCSCSIHILFIMWWIVCLKLDLVGLLIWFYISMTALVGNFLFCIVYQANTQIPNRLFYDCILQNINHDIIDSPPFFSEFWCIVVIFD